LDYGDDDIKAYEKHYKAKMFKTGLNNPYLELQSASTGGKYRLYIAFGKLQELFFLSHLCGGEQYFKYKYIYCNNDLGEK
jgi:hypothetical protein